MNKSPTHIDALLEPLLSSGSEEQSDALLSQLISTHVEPVIKRVIRYKLRFNASQATEVAEADDIQRSVRPRWHSSEPGAVSDRPEAQRLARMGWLHLRSSKRPIR